jgi:hypothetical protein
MADKQQRRKINGASEQAAKYGSIASGRACCFYLDAASFYSLHLTVYFHQPAAAAVSGARNSCVMVHAEVARCSVVSLC